MKFALMHDYVALAFIQIRVCNLINYRENTLLQTTAVDRWTVGGCKRPSPHFGPNPPIRTPDETGVVSTYGAALRMMNGIGGIDNEHSNHNEFTPTEENGIDLGSKCKLLISRFPNCLPFTHRCK